MSLKKAAADGAAFAFAVAASPILRFIGKHRIDLRRFQSFADRAGFQIRSTDYYEPTYAESHLPPDTRGERFLPGIDMNEAGQLELLASFAFAEELRAIPRDPASPAHFGYANKMYNPGDAQIYYNMIRTFRPRRIIEVGSGNSTLMALLAIAANAARDPAYTCHITCIEPYEMPWLETTGVEVVRERVEQIGLERFASLGDGDILFVDSSHVVRPRGDVLREFQEILPSLAPGVLVHVHDIFTPFDYPELWLRGQRRLWNEQYLLEAFLAFNDRFSIICANNWLMHRHQAAFCRACPMTPSDNEPGGFWMRVTGPGSQKARNH